MIGLPPLLQAAIDAEVASHPGPALAGASAAVSAQYAAGRPSPHDDRVWQAAYLATRMPATYAAVHAALSAVPGTMLADVRTLLDLGTGPGTATWAAAACCPALASVVQADRSASWLSLGARLSPRTEDGREIDVTRRVADIGAAGDWPASDLVVCAYALTELGGAGRGRAVAAAWQAASRVLVVVEPGTPDGFGHIHEARTALIRAGARVVAPCPHGGTCPMRDGASASDWCHFAVRVSRSRRHRQLKGGTLGYEDEKYAYLVVAKGDGGGAPAAEARILRHPRVEKGRIGLTLCTPEGLRRLAVSRRDPAWRAARKARWGDAWAAPVEPV